MAISKSQVVAEPKVIATHCPTGWCVYIVECADGSLYTGITNDIGRRLAEHNKGTGARYTRSRRPVRLVYTEPARNRSSAAQREAAIKSLRRNDKQALL